MVSKVQHNRPLRPVPAPKERPFETLSGVLQAGKTRWRCGPLSAQYLQLTSRILERIWERPHHIGCNRDVFCRFLQAPGVSNHDCRVRRLAKHILAKLQLHYPHALTMVQELGPPAASRFQHGLFSEEVFSFVVRMQPSAVADHANSWTIESFLEITGNMTILRPTEWFTHTSHRRCRLALTNRSHVKLCFLQSDK